MFGRKKINYFVHASLSFYHYRLDSIEF